MGATALTGLTGPEAPERAHAGAHAEVAPPVGDVEKRKLPVAAVLSGAAGAGLMAVLPVAAVRGHSKIPISGHEKAASMATKNPHVWSGR